MEDKKTWTREVGELLKKDRRSGVKSISYTKETNEQGWIREIVRIDYNGGGHAEIDVYGNSLGSILHEVVREVYEGRAIGRI